MRGGFGVFVETEIDDRSYHTPPADGVSRSSAGVLIDANLACRASALTTFLFTAQATFIAVGSSGGLARQLGFEGAMSSGAG